MLGLSGEELSQIRNDTLGVMRALGRPILVNVVTSTGCQVCGGVDDTTGFPVDPLCHACSGTGKAETTEPIQIQGTIKWGSTDELSYQEPGRVSLGMCRIAVEPQWRSLFKEGMTLQVDGETVNVVSITASGIGQVNRIIVECQKIVTS